jgi:hypothetical protein
LSRPFAPQYDRLGARDLAFFGSLGPGRHRRLRAAVRGGDQSVAVSCAMTIPKTIIEAAGGRSPRAPASSPQTSSDSWPRQAAGKSGITVWRRLLDRSPGRSVGRSLPRWDNHLTVSGIVRHMVSMTARSVWRLNGQDERNDPVGRWPSHGSPGQVAGWSGGRWQHRF